MSSTRGDEPRLGTYEGVPDVRPAHRDERQSPAGSAAAPDVAVDHRIARLAARQHGCVSVAQLRALGLSSSAIDRRARAGRLFPRWRGVHAVALALPRWAPESAALLACGESSVLSHTSAASLWGFTPAQRTVHVTVPRQRRPRGGLVVHHSVVAPRDRTARERLRVTGAARTIADLTTMLDSGALERMVADALARKLTTADDLRGRGSRFLTSLFDDDGPAYTRSEAERRLVALIRKSGLPAPRTKAKVAGLEVDALWAERRLVVEVDGFLFHGHRIAFETDRKRDQRLLMAGYTVVRITWRQLTREPEVVIALIAAALAGRTSGGPPLAARR